MTYQLKTSRPNLYDYLKVLAILTMVLDHVGYFLFPGEVWLRIIGRAAFPLFLFLVGFNASFRWRWSLWSMALLAHIAYRFHQGGSIFALHDLNILFGIAFARLLLSVYQRSYHHLITLLLMAVFIVFGKTVEQYFDYGGMVFVFALFGYFVRMMSTSTLPGSLRSLLMVLMGTGIYAAQAYFQIKGGRNTYFINHGMTHAWWIVGSVYGLTLLSFVLLAWKNISIHLGASLDKVIVWISRWALWLYVIHLAIIVVIKRLVM